jgi:hypothetical protein
MEGQCSEGSRAGNGRTLVRRAGHGCRARPRVPVRARRSRPRARRSSGGARSSRSCSRRSPITCKGNSERRWGSPRRGTSIRCRCCSSSATTSAAAGQPCGHGSAGARIRRRRCGGNWGWDYPAPCLTTRGWEFVAVAADSLLRCWPSPGSKGRRRRCGCWRPGWQEGRGSRVWMNSIDPGIGGCAGAGARGWSVVYSRRSIECAPPGR